MTERQEVVKTALEYKRSAYEEMGTIVRHAKQMPQDELHARLQRYGDLIRLSAMAEMAEQSMAKFTFESKVSRLDEVPAKDWT